MVVEFFSSQIFSGLLKMVYFQRRTDLHLGTHILLFSRNISEYMTIKRKSDKDVRMCYLHLINNFVRFYWKRTVYPLTRIFNVAVVFYNEYPFIETTYFLRIIVISCCR